jgi:hypothetical protein
MNSQAAQSMNPVSVLGQNTGMLAIGSATPTRRRPKVLSVTEMLRESRRSQKVEDWTWVLLAGSATALLVLSIFV